mmetsp:Transcript_33653/g.94681  ORF Transcript_33653/g.94681 Transcript_33653/m.94681 type:complete len:422 (+) Transcript_33653:148-1413(+)|eukprot:CAMPEP_0119136142 /NCGR_PEP_ID=MMETSP1310-20130426/20799_1 /TAXON_ID=464262 /ORGANISM="Genus nov. species nov., Strain RCC2339" /LENGTH=421 /DNA_ID=CAMNT_0007127109 /DNA_START=143 /DNA_END=1408 /DNA_ORIENTATION=+
MAGLMNAEDILHLISSHVDPSTSRKLHEVLSQNVTVLQLIGDRFEEILCTLDVAVHTLGYVHILHGTVLQLKGNPPPRTFLGFVESLVQNGNTDQLRIAVQQFCGVMEKYADAYMESGAIRSVPCLREGILRIQKSEAALTPLHALVLRAFIRTVHYKEAIAYLGDGVLFEIDHSLTFQPDKLLLFFYYSACVYIGVKNFSKALQFLSLVFYVPGNGASTISVEAYKKYVLVSLLLNGKYVALSFGNGKGVQREVRHLCAEYHEIEADAKSMIWDNLEKKYKGCLSRDGNYGLFKQVIVALKMHRVKRLQDTFITLSRQEVSARANIPEEEVEGLLVRMVKSGHVRVKLDHKTDMVRFESNDCGEDTGAVVATLAKEVERSMEYTRKLRKLADGLACSQPYLDAKVKAAASKGSFPGPNHE